MTPKSSARFLTGGSTGGWEALALQAYHPDFFNGALAGKLHFYCGDMDSDFFNLAAYLFEDAMNALRDPAPRATFAWGRPLKRHGWHGITNTALIREMAVHVKQSAP